MLLRALVLATSLSVALAACGDDDKKYDPMKAVGLQTTVAPGEVGVGERATVTCTRVNGKGEPLAGGAFTIGIAPLDASFVDGVEVFSNAAGPHQITCSDGELGLVDDSPAELVVRAGPPVETRLVIDPATVAAGDDAAVTCQAFDAYGNVAAANLRLDVVPPDSVTTDGVASIAATATGTYEVTCFAAAVEEGARAKATLTVVPGPRAAIALRFDPEARAYALGQPVLVKAVGVDALGNAIAGDIQVQGLAAAPDGHHTIQAEGQEIYFDLEGRYTISATAKDDPSQSATAPLVVDQTKPLLQIDTPERGLVTDTLEVVRVSGTISDNLGALESLTIAGQRVNIAPAGGKFTADIPLRYGVTLLDMHAVDAQGLETLVTRAVEQGLGGFTSMQQRTIAADGTKNGAAVVLAQAAFDDGEEEEVRDDLASIIEFIVENFDFTSFAPNPLASFSCISGTCELAFTDTTIGDVQVTMTLSAGRIHLKVDLVEFAGEMTLSFPCDTPVICTTRPRANLPATLGTNRVTLDSDIFVSVVEGEVVTTAENTVVVIDGLVVTAAGDPTGLLEAALTGAITLIEDFLVTAMEQLIVGLVEDQVAGALGGLFSALVLDETFDLPSPVPSGAPNTIVLETRPAGVDISPERLQLRVDALAHAQTPARPHDHLGSLRHSGCSPEQALQFPPPEPITVALHDDLINQLLFAIWEGGTLSLDLADGAADELLGQFGLVGASIKVDAYLPPVFESCRGGEGVGTVQLGDLFLEIESEFAGEPLHLGLWLLAEAPIDVAVAENAEGALEASLVLDAIEPLWIEVAINQGPFASDEAAVIGLVKDALIPRLLGTVTESATFTLPTIDLGALTSAVPAGTTIDLDIRDITRDNAYMTIYGALK